MWGVSLDVPVHTVENTVQTAAGKRKDTVDVKSLHHWRDQYLRTPQ